jgi:predicted CopG family antitoxin
MSYFYEAYIYTMRAILDVIVMTTISITGDVKEKLLKIASELQIKLGRRVNLNEAIRFLISEREKKPQLLDEACKPTPEIEKVLKELYEERKLDEERLERKISIRHRRID